MFAYGTSSSLRLLDLHPRAADVCRQGLEMSDIDWSIIQTIRTLEEQQANMDADPQVSWTLDSYHIPQPGSVLARAVDIYPYVDGKTSHDLEHYRRVGKWMFAAAQHLGVYTEWGGFWWTPDRPHWQFTEL